jgi:hypothetical protein
VMEASRVRCSSYFLVQSSECPRYVQGTKCATTQYCPCHYQAILGRLRGVVLVERLGCSPPSALPKPVKYEEKYLTVLLCKLRRYLLMSTVFQCFLCIFHHYWTSISPGVQFAIPWEFVQIPYARFRLCMEMELCRREHIQFEHTQIISS